MGQHEAELIKALAHRRAGMDAEYSAWEPHFRELRDNIQPSRGRFSLGEKSGATLNKKIIDSTARKAMRTLTSGLMSGMTSPNRKWFKLGLHDDALEDEPDVKAYLHETEKMMYRILRGSNIYRTLAAAYGDLALYGTFAGLIVSDFEDVIISHAMPVGTYRIQEDHKGRVNVLHREALQTVAQVVKKFGLKNCSERVRKLYEADNLYSFVAVNHAIEEREKYDPASPFANKKQFGSYYWEAGQTTSLLQESGFNYNPVLGPRWERIEGEAWGTSSPGMDALGDAVQLQVQHRDKAIAIQMSYKPPLQGGSGSSKGFRYIPGGVSTLSVTDIQKGGLRPIADVRPDISGLVADINETRQRISAAFYEDLFLMTSMSDRRQVTAREISERHEEKLLVLGPVLESLDNGLLSPIIEATFANMQSADILPPAPDSIVGKPIRVEYISLLAQAQRAVGVASIERTMGFAGSLAQLKPEVLDVIDGDAMLREFTDQIGPPPKMLLPEDKVSKNREARAQQQQQQAMVDQAPQMAQAAKLISEAGNRGTAGLQKAGVAL